MNQESEVSNPAIPAAENLASKPPVKAAARPRAVEKIRSELNVEKWPAIWQPAKSKNKPTLRVMEREVTAANGNRVVSRVEVGYTQLGTLSTEEQKMLYVLIKLWEESGKPDTQVFFSSRSLARMLKKKGWGTNVIEAITKSLRKLRTIPIEWINSYFDLTKEGAVVVDRRPFTLLGELRVVERRQDGAVNSSQGYFKFDDHVLQNLLLNYTKPVCIEEFFKLQSEIAQLIYSHIDLMLFDKNKYERRSRELFDDLGLKNAEYQHMYERRRAIDKALKELNGIRLSSGVLRSATVEKTADGKDYKLSFSKGAATAADLPSSEKFPVAATQGVVINHFSKQKDPLVTQAEELVQYFYQVFHNVDSHQPQSKETGQALSLIAQHGLETSQAIVQFARDIAAKTNYQVQHFGAVLSYTSRALTALRAQQAAPRAARPSTGSGVPPAAAEGEAYDRGERRWERLTEEQRERRFEQAKSELFRERPFLAQVWKADSKIHENTIRVRVLRNLEIESMELIAFDPDLIVTYPWYHPVTQNLPL